MNALTEIAISDDASEWQLRLMRTPEEHRCRGVHPARNPCKKRRNNDADATENARLSARLPYLSPAAASRTSEVHVATRSARSRNARTWSAISPTGSRDIAARNPEDAGDTLKAQKRRGAEVKSRRWKAPGYYRPGSSSDRTISWKESTHFEPGVSLAVAEALERQFAATTEYVPCLSMILLLDGIKGESNDASKGEIDVRSFSWGVAQTGPGTPGMARVRE